MSLINAFKAFFGVLSGRIDADLLFNPPEAVSEPVQEEEPEDPKTLEIKRDPKAEKAALKAMYEEGAIFSLILLQREGRLIDFLKENIDSFDDSQVGAAVRQIHAGCRNALEEHFAIKAIMDSQEGQQVEVEDGFDPSEIKMTGNAPERPPYNGTLQHKGWTVDSITLPERSGKINKNVIYPAEISF